VSELYQLHASSSLTSRAHPTGVLWASAETGAGAFLTGPACEEFSSS